MGDLNARVGASDTNLRAAGRHLYDQVSNDDGKTLIDLCEADNMCIATT